MPNNRNNTFVLKVSNVSGKIPQISNLMLGEVAVNVADAKMYSLYTAGASAATQVLAIGWDRLATTGGTLTGPLYGTTISATTLYSNGILLTGDTYVTGLTYNQNTGILNLTQNNGVSYTAVLSIPSYITGFTYNNANTLTIANSTGGTLNTSINTVTGLTVNGTLVSTTVSATSYFYGNGSNLIGVATANTFTTASTYNNGTLLFTRNDGGTYSTPITTIYATDGVLQGNRTINLSSYTLNFSSATNPNTLYLNNGNVGVGKNPAYTLDVNGDINIPTTLGASGNIRQNGNILLAAPNTNLWLGLTAGNSSSGGTYNLGIGPNAMNDFWISGGSNVAIGAFALYNINYSFGNTAVGVYAGSVIGPGSGNTYNTVFGYNAMSNGAPSAVSGNTAIGALSLYKNTGVIGNNTSVGYQSFYNNIGGGLNVGLGYQAGYFETGSSKLYIANSSASTLVYGDFNAGRLGINATGFSNTNPETLVVSATSTTSSKVIGTYGVVPSYFGIINQNKSNNIGASTDFIAVNDTGNDANIGFIDMGINSSTYSGFAGYANDGYLFTYGSNLWVGNLTTGATGSNLYLFAGSSGLTPNMMISGVNGFVGVNTSAITNALTVSAASNPVRFIGLAGGSDSLYLTVDATGVVHTGAGSTGGTSNAATGGTYSAGTITLSGTGVLGTITGLISANTYTTGATFTNNILLLPNNSGNTISTIINNFTGLTVTAATNTVQLIGLSGLTGASDINVLTVNSVGTIHTVPITNVLLTAGTVNNVTGLTISLANWYNSYSTFDIILSNVVPVTKGAVLLSRLSPNGNTFSSNTGSYRWMFSSLSDTGTTNVNSAQSSATGISLCYSAITAGSGGTTYGISSGASQGWNGTIRMYNASATTTQTHISVSNVAYFNTFNSLTSGFGSGVAIATGATQGIQFLFSSGNTSSAVFRVIGYL